MKKITTIAIASLFTTSALFAAGSIQTQKPFGYSVETELLGAIEKTEDFGYSVETELLGAIEKTEDFGYSVETELLG